MLLQFLVVEVLLCPIMLGFVYKFFVPFFGPHNQPCTNQYDKDNY